MELLDRPLTPFVYFVRRLRSDAGPLTFADEPGMRRLYGLWRQVDGTTTLRRGAETTTIRPGEVALSQPGMRVVVQRRARVTYCAFALLPRLRLIDGNTVTIEVAEPAEPDWQALFGQDLPVALPPSHQRRARDLVDHVSLNYWRSAAHRQAAGLRLGAWLLDLAAEGSAVEPIDSLVQDLDDLIAARAREPVTVADLARQLGVSPAHCARCYRARRGIGPAEALRNARMAQAQEILLQDDGSIAEIAARVGYRDANAFNRAFRRIVGLPPGRWRRQQRRLVR